jgi:hypothetical protein
LSKVTWTPAAIEARKQYYREYRRKNRERIHEIEARYWDNVAKRRKRIAVSGS